MAVSSATTAANELPRYRYLRIFWYKTKPKHPLCMQWNPLCMQKNPLCMGIPGNSQKRAVFEPGIPMGIPAIPDLGNSRFGNSR
jgi:hypothetical protein